MKRIIFIVFALALSTLISISGFTKAKIKNPVEIEIVPSSNALIAINNQNPFQISIHKAGNEDMFVTPEQVKASVKITNHSTRNLVIKSIRCTTADFFDMAIADFKPSLPAGRTMVVDINVANSSSLVDVHSLAFGFKAEWDGGKTDIQFNVPIVQVEDNGQDGEEVNSGDNNLTTIDTPQQPDATEAPAPVQG